jgi:hypothetical protein
MEQWQMQIQEKAVLMNDVGDALEFASEYVHRRKRKRKQKR